MEDAFHRLDKLTPEEALMAAAETMTVTRDIDDTVKDIDKRVKDADDRVKGVDGRVGSVIQGRLSFPPMALALNLSSPLLPSGVKESGVVIQQVFNQVNDLNRESSFNFIAADHKVSNIRTGNELHKDLRKWIAPPDPSVNFNTATDAHHEGTAAWCTKGDTVLTWKESGSLLWIHGKRIYPITIRAIFSLTTPSLIAGSGKSILRCATPHRVASQAN